MRGKKQIRRGDKIGLKLTSAERTLLLEGLTCLPTQYEQAINGTPTSEPVMLTLDDLDDLGGYVAADANHATNKQFQKKLDAIFQKIQRLLETHSDDEPPETGRTDDAKKTNAMLKKEKTKKPKADPTTLFQFKITLLESKPSIWRRIQVKDCTLDKLHEHIQTAMGWTNSHLNQFKIGEQLYGDPLLMDENFEEFVYKDSTKTLLSDIVPKNSKQFRFLYEYDFGDSWEHEVLFEGCPMIEADRQYPLCLEGERACPPEDVGGIGGYEAFLETIDDPDHEEHEDMLRWAGGKFDPKTFDANAATKAMMKGLPDWRKQEWI
jgi:hypothetical protein